MAFIYLEKFRSFKVKIYENYVFISISLFFTANLLLFLPKLQPTC